MCTVLLRSCVRLPHLQGEVKCTPRRPAPRLLSESPASLAASPAPRAAPRLRGAASRARLPQAFLCLCLSLGSLPRGWNYKCQAGWMLLCFDSFSSVALPFACIASLLPAPLLGLDKPVLTPPGLGLPTSGTQVKPRAPRRLCRPCSLVPVLPGCRGRARGHRPCSPPWKPPPSSSISFLPPAVRALSICFA